MRFRGKVAVWFYLLILFVAAVCVPILIVSIWVDPSLLGAISISVTFVLIESFCLSIVFRNYLELGEDTLRIVFGVIEKRIPYREIITLSKTKDPSSSLAASLDRIKIRRKGKAEVMVAVVDQDGFLREMKARCPAITVF